MPNLKGVKAPFPPGWADVDEDKPQPDVNAISPNDYFALPATVLSKIPRPCGHEIEIEVSYTQSRSIGSAQRKELREKILSTPCPECIKEQENVSV